MREYYDLLHDGSWEDLREWRALRRGRRAIRSRSSTSSRSGSSRGFTGTMRRATRAAHFERVVQRKEVPDDVPEFAAAARRGRRTGSARGPRSARNGEIAQRGAPTGRTARGEPGWPARRGRHTDPGDAVPISYRSVRGDSRASCSGIRRSERGVSTDGSGTAQLRANRGVDRSRGLSYTEPPGFQGWLFAPPRLVFGFGCSGTGISPKLRSVFENRIACGPSSRGKARWAACEANYFPFRSEQLDSVRIGFSNSVRSDRVPGFNWRV